MCIRDRLLGGQFSNFLPGKVSLEFKLHGISIFHDIQMATYFGRTGWCYSHTIGYAGSPTCAVYVNVTLTRSKVKVKVTDHLNFRQLPINVHFQVYLLCHFRVEIKTDGWYWQYGTWSTASRRPIFEFPSRKGITRVQASRNVDISRHSNGHIFRHIANVNVSSRSLTGVTALHATLLTL